jgi:hypothetical protein
MTWTTERKAMFDIKVQFYFIKIFFKPFFIKKNLIILMFFLEFFNNFDLLISKINKNLKEILLCIFIKIILHRIIKYTLSCFTITCVNHLITLLFNLN